MNRDFWVAISHHEQGFFFKTWNSWKGSARMEMRLFSPQNRLELSTIATQIYTGMCIPALKGVAQSWIAHNAIDPINLTHNWQHLELLYPQDFGEISTTKRGMFLFHNLQ